MTYCDWGHNNRGVSNGLKVKIRCSKLLGIPTAVVKDVVFLLLGITWFQITFQHICTSFGKFWNMRENIYDKLPKKKKKQREKIKNIGSDNNIIDYYHIIQKNWKWRKELERTWDGIYPKAAHMPFCICSISHPLSTSPHTSPQSSYISITNTNIESCQNELD